MKKQSLTELLLWLVVITSIISTACSLQVPLFASIQSQPDPTATLDSDPATATPAPTSTATETITPSPAPTYTATVTPSPTITQSPTLTPTPTADVPQATALMQAFCRYGPGKAYLYSHGLYEGDRAEIHGKNYSGTWLWIKPENLDRECWAAASVLEVQGDLSKVHVVTTRLPHSTFYGPPKVVAATRDGSQVTVSWKQVWMTKDDDRGYLIEATICQNGNRFSVAVQTDKPYYEFTDEPGCGKPSGGKLYTVDKHGYSNPVTIPWP